MTNMWILIAAMNLIAFFFMKKAVLSLEYSETQTGLRCEKEVEDLGVY
jgi:hypothetical protein